MEEKKNALATLERGQLVPAETVREITAGLTGQISALAEMLRITNERMAAMEKTIRTLEKVTPTQARNINQAIRERAAELCAEYLIGRSGVGGFHPDLEAMKAIAAAIRREVREITGAQTMKAVARCDYDTMIALILDWDDYEMMKRLRNRRREEAGA